MLRNLLFAVTLFALAVPASAIEKKALTGEDARLLSEIAWVAAKAQAEAGFLEAYVRGRAIDWRHVVMQTAILADRTRTLERLIAQFERREPNLTEAQQAEFERMKTGLAAMKIFVNNTYRLAAENKTQLLFRASELMAQASAVSSRGKVIRESARGLREKAA